MKRLLIFLLAAMLAPAVCGQDDFLTRGELLLSAGGMNYMGDLNNQSVLGQVDLAASAGLRYRLNNRMAVSGAVAAGRIHGGNPDAIELRNLSFRSDVYELTMRMEFNFFPYGGGATDWQWTPYIFGGLGAFHFNPQASYLDNEGNEKWVDLQPLGTEGQNLAEYPNRVRYTLNQFCVPFGLGVKLRLTRWFALSAEYGFRATWTDYLDDVSTTYVGAAALSGGTPDGGLAARLADRSSEVREGYVNEPGIKRGDDSLNDWYQMFTVSVAFNLDAMLGWTRSKRCRIR